MFEYMTILLLVLNYSCGRLIPHDQLPIRHHLRWVTNQTQFPLKLTVPISHENEPPRSTWDWVRLSDNHLITDLSDLFKNYLVTETDAKTELYIINLNESTSEQLSAYEPKLLVLSDEDQTYKVANTNERNIFSLAQLKRHFIHIEKSPERTKVTCQADFLLPKNEFVAPIMAQMEKYSVFKIQFKSSKKNTEITNKQHPSLRNHHKPSMLFMYDMPRLNNPFQSTNLHEQQYIQYIQNFLNNFKFNPFNSNLYQQQPQQSPAVQQHQMQQQSQHQPQLQQQQLFFQQPINHQIQQQLQQPVQQFNNFMSSFFPLMRKKRQVKSDIKNELDYDQNKFLIVRLSLGPVSVYEPYDHDEIVTCELNLLNTESMNVVHSSHVMEKLHESKTEQQQQQHAPSSHLEANKSDKTIEIHNTNGNNEIQSSQSLLIKENNNNNGDDEYGFIDLTEVKGYVKKNHTEHKPEYMNRLEIDLKPSDLPIHESILQIHQKSSSSQAFANQFNIIFFLLVNLIYFLY